MARTPVFDTRVAVLRLYHEPTYHFNHSPYIFGRSPRTYDSNVRLSTVAQSRSRLSSSILSSDSSCPSAPVAVAVAVAVFLSDARASFSPAAKRGPRSGKLRHGSKGRHLCERRHVGWDAKREEETSRAYQKLWKW